MESFIIVGTVPEFSGSEFLMPIDNGREFRDWLRSNRIETIVTEVGGKPAIKIRGSFAAECSPGLKIRYSVECWERRDGHRIRGLNVNGL